MKKATGPCRGKNGAAVLEEETGRGREKKKENDVFSGFIESGKGGLMSESGRKGGGQSNRNRGGGAAGN